MICAVLANIGRSWHLFSSIWHEHCPYDVVMFSEKEVVVMMQSSYARRVLWGNAIFSGVSGGLFSLASTIVAAFLGVDAPLAVTIIGIGLLAYAALIVWYVTRPTISWVFVLCAAIADTVWVLLSAVLLVTNVITLSSAGMWAVVVVALIVGGFAVAQYQLVRVDRGA